MSKRNVKVGDNSSIRIEPHASKKTLSKIRKTIAKDFHDKTDYYLNMKVDDYRESMLQAQNDINSQKMGFLLVKQIEPDLVNHLGTDSFLIQSSVFLRASRSFANSDTENVGCHRETFYGEEIGKSINCCRQIWFQYLPKKIVSGVDLSNATKLIVGDGESALFSGNLIQGAAINKDKSIRFSVDFRLIRKADYKLEDKSRHITSSKPYFTEFC